MSSCERNFQHFNTMNGEGTHKHRTSKLPRIPKHGLVAHHEPLEECHLCSEHRRIQDLDSLESALDHNQSCHHHHHHHPQQYGLRRPTRPVEPSAAHSTDNRRTHHRGYKKTVVLVRNSDPSFRKSIILHRRSLQTLELFLEEVSQLMQYHVRGLCTVEGRKIDSVESLMQCPSVLVCIGPESSHPSVLENFQKTCDEKLPMLKEKSRPPGHADEHEVNQEVPTKKTAIHPKLDSINGSARQSVSSDKSLPDGTESVDSFLHTGDVVINDDVEKRVCVNKDGSLSMKMKVRFRLQNDETLQWSTAVRRTAGRSRGDLKGDNKLLRARATDNKNYTQSEHLSNGTLDPACINKHGQKQEEELHCPQCCSQCKEYEIWRGTIPERRGESHYIPTSSSSASSCTAVSRKTVVESRQTLSCSSDEHSDQVLEEEACLQRTTEAAKTLEFCTIRSETRSPKSTIEEKDLKIVENVSSAVSRAGSSCQNSKHEGQQSTESETLISQSPLKQSSKSRKSRNSHSCQCKISDVPEDVKKGLKTQFEGEDDVRTKEKSAMSFKSHLSGRSSKSEETENSVPEDAEEKRSRSATSVNSSASNTQRQIHDDEEKHKTPFRSESEKCVKSELAQNKSEEAADEEIAPQEVENNAEDVTQIGETGDVQERTPTVASSKSNTRSSLAMSGVSSQSNAGGSAEEEAETVERSSSTGSKRATKSKASAMSTKSKASEEMATASMNQPELSNSEDGKENAQNATSESSNASQQSRKSSVSDLLAEEKHLDVKESERASSAMSVRSLRSHESGASRKSKVCRERNEPNPGDEENMERPNSSKSNISNPTAQTRESQGSDVHGLEDVGSTADESAEGETEGRPLSSMFVTSTNSVNSNILAKYKTSSTKDIDDAPNNDEEQAGERAESCTSAKSSVSKSKENMDDENIKKTPSPACSSDDGNPVKEETCTVMSENSESKTSAKSAFKARSEENDEDTAEKALSAKSATSTNSNTSSKSTKLKDSQVPSKHTDLNSEGDVRSPSCMSDKSGKSRMSSNSSHYKHCVTSDHETERGVKSGQSNVSAKSTLSNICSKGMPKPSNVPDEEGNRSAKSDRPATSRVSATSVKSKEMTGEEDTQARAISSISAQSLESERSNESKRSVDAPDEKSWKSPEEVQTDETASRSTSATSAQLHHSETYTGSEAADGKHKKRPKRTPSTSSAASVRSHASAISTESNASDVLSEQTHGIPAKGNGDEDAEKRAHSAMSGKSAKSAISAKSTLSKGMNTAVDEEENEAQDPSNVSVRSAKSSNASGISKKSKASTVSYEFTADIPEREHTGEDNVPAPGDTVGKAPSTSSAKSEASSEVSKSKNLDVPEDEEASERPGSKMSSRSATLSQKSKVAGISSEHSAETAEGDNEVRVASPMSRHSEKSCTSAKSTSACGGAPGENSSNDYVIERAPKAAQSDKSSKSKPSNSPRDANHEDLAERSLSNTSTQSAASRKSICSGKSMKSKSADVSGVDSDNSDEDTKNRGMSSVSTKSVRSHGSQTSSQGPESGKEINKSFRSSRKPGQSKSSDISAEDNSDSEETKERTPNAISVISPRSRKSTTSELRAEENMEETKRTPSILSAKSKASQRSVKSNLSNITPAENICSEESDERTHCGISTKSSKSNKMKDSETSLTGGDECPDRAQGKDKAASVPKSKDDYFSPLPNSDIVKATEDSASTRPIRLTSGLLDTVVSSVSEKKSDNGKKCEHEETDVFELVPTSLPNASPAEVVNEWLKAIPSNSDMYDMDEFHENCSESKPARLMEDLRKMEDNVNMDDSANDGVVMNGIPSYDHRKCQEAGNTDNCCAQIYATSKTFHSSVQVMKVLLNPKSDRCNSLPEISRVYGRKLSNSAQGLLDCLMKLHLIDCDPKNSKEKDDKYQELMNILQSLWLCDPPQNEHAIKENDQHFVDDEFHHTSSSGVDVNSGSTSSGKSSDGTNGGVFPTHAAVQILHLVPEISESQEEADALYSPPSPSPTRATQTQLPSRRNSTQTYEAQQKDNHPGTDDTIRSDDGPTEQPKSPPSSHKSPENDHKAQKSSEDLQVDCLEDTNTPIIEVAELAKRPSRDCHSDWVLSLLSEIKMQFMMHYTNAVSEFKDHWSLDDKLDVMLGDLKNDIEKRIQTCIERQARKIQDKAGQTSPVEEEIPRYSTMPREDRRRRTETPIKQPNDPQADSNESATLTSYSDQRSDDSDEHCPCETCQKKNSSSTLTLTANVTTVGREKDEDEAILKNNNNNDATEDDGPINGEEIETAATSEDTSAQRRTTHEGTPEVATATHVTEWTFTEDQIKVFSVIEEAAEKQSCDFISNNEDGSTDTTRGSAGVRTIKAAKTEAQEEVMVPAEEMSEKHISPVSATDTETAEADLQNVMTASDQHSLFSQAPTAESENESNQGRALESMTAREQEEAAATREDDTAEPKDDTDTADQCAKDPAEYEIVVEKETSELEDKITESSEEESKESGEDENAAAAMTRNGSQAKVFVETATAEPEEEAAIENADCAEENDEVTSESTESVERARSEDELDATKDASVTSEDESKEEKAETSGAEGENTADTDDDSVEEEVAEVGADQGEDQHDNTDTITETSK